MSSTPAKSPQGPSLSNNDPSTDPNMLTAHGDSASRSGDQDHPDSPLPIVQTQPQIQTRGEHAYEYEQHEYNCESGSEVETQEPLTESEPRPIEDYEDTIAAASRPRHAWQVWWLRNKGMGLVLLAQMFAASMNVMTQVLEIHSAMHPFQILFARMSITAVASYLYMYWASTPHPLGTRPVRGLLMLRAVCGFTGVYGLYYSVQYLPLSEATVITFLAPIMTCYACSLLIPGETFSRKQQLAALVSLAGVVLIARPFSKREPHTAIATPTAAATWMLGLSASGADETPSDTDSYHHVMATIVAFVGVLGAAGAYTSIRMIGRRAHPLVSVTYFSSVTTVISFVAMAVVPSVPFRLPNTAVEWSLLTGLGVCGFLLQFLLTAGLSYVPPASVSNGKPVSQGSRATSMVYTQMLFAVFYDKVVWGSTLSPISWVGSGVILACAVYVATAQEGPAPRREETPVQEEYRDSEGYKDATDEERAEASAGRECGH
ncbi:Drug/metabolite transporter [Penicillium paradoxum]|uniref:Drug/metabolite transporter n=1 Tax=Penicillium paradoxum TaxID=176176 RepID=UPI002547DEC8|nr:Drug/metabolite transporter [Penicillium paradoxum]KAJ5772878.1 Drug/metabolite transporter [Penicillium paradoxum]